MPDRNYLLLAAADVIERNGKASGVYVDNDQMQDAGTPLHQLPMCALGAIGYVDSGVPGSCITSAANSAVEAIVKSIDSEYRFVGHGPRTVMMVGDWSDANPAETVVARLRDLGTEDVT